MERATWRQYWLFIVNILFSAAQTTYSLRKGFLPNFKLYEVKLSYPGVSASYLPL